MDAILTKLRGDIALHITDRSEKASTLLALLADNEAARRQTAYERQQAARLRAYRRENPLPIAA